MSYSHRYYYLFVCMLLITTAAYIFDVKYLLAEHAEMLAKVEMIKAKMRAAQRENMQAATPFQQVEEQFISKNFSQFSRLAHAFHLEILSAASVRPQDDEVSQVDDYNIILRGDYINLYQFFVHAALMEVKNLLLIPEFQQRVRAEMRVRLSREIAAQDAVIFHVVNPFCGAEKPHEPRNFSRDEMQYLGTVMRDQHRYGIELSPDGVVKEVREN